MAAAAWAHPRIRHLEADLPDQVPDAPPPRPPGSAHRSGVPPYPGAMRSKGAAGSGGRAPRRLREGLEVDSTLGPTAAIGPCATVATLGRGRDHLAHHGGHHGRQTASPSKERLLVLPRRGGRLLPAGGSRRRDASPWWRSAAPRPASGTPPPHLRRSASRAPPRATLRLGDHPAVPAGHPPRPVRLRSLRRSAISACPPKVSSPGSSARCASSPAPRAACCWRHSTMPRPAPRPSPTRRMACTGGAAAGRPGLGDLRPVRRRRALGRRPAFEVPLEMLVQLDPEAARPGQVLTIDPGTGGTAFDLGAFAPDTSGLLPLRAPRRAEEVRLAWADESGESVDLGALRLPDEIAAEAASGWACPDAPVLVLAVAPGHPVAVALDWLPLAEAYARLGFPPGPPTAFPATPARGGPPRRDRGGGGVRAGVRRRLPLRRRPGGPGAGTGLDDRRPGASLRLRPRHGAPRRGSRPTLVGYLSRARCWRSGSCLRSPRTSRG